MKQFEGTGTKVVQTDCTTLTFIVQHLQNVNSVSAKSQWQDYLVDHEMRPVI